MGKDTLLVSPVELKAVNHNADTFFVNFKFLGPDGRPNGQPLPDYIADQLDTWQKNARKEHIHVPTSLTFTYWAGDQTYSQTLMMREHGSSPWSWLLYSDDVKINMSYGTLKQRSTRSSMNCALKGVNQKMATPKLTLIIFRISHRRYCL